jgi:ESS family glutamate:Na+ symporter
MIPDRVKLDLVQTLAFTGVVLFAAYGIKRALPVLTRLSIPAPVIGGLIVAVAITVARGQGVTLLEFDVTLYVPLMFAFFTAIGFGAGFAMLRAGGWPVVLFLIVSSVAAVLQNVVGAAVAVALGQNPLLGVLTGSVALTGGPATAASFAPKFEEAGVPGAATLGVAAAMAGILSGGLLGGPIGALFSRRSRHPAARPAASAEAVRDAEAPAPPPPADEDPGAAVLLRALVALLVAMALGQWVGRGIEATGLTLPGYIGAMLVAAVLRNVDDATGWLRLPHRLIDDLGNAALSLFLVLALMRLELWKLAGFALPLVVLVLVQVALVLALCVPIWRLMGRDYEAAVMTSGFTGFMLGTTANAMANMGAVVERFGPAPKAFLVVPLVGAGFIDFVNGLVVAGFLNVFR